MSVRVGVGVGGSSSGGGGISGGSNGVSGGGMSAFRSSVLTLALSRTDGEAHCNRALWLLGAH